MNAHKWLLLFTQTNDQIQYDHHNTNEHEHGKRREKIWKNATTKTEEKTKRNTKQQQQQQPQNTMKT